VTDLGASYELILRLDGGLELTARALEDHRLRPGEPCHVTLRREAITVWPAAEPS
jgi:hypothetical protein